MPMPLSRLALWRMKLVLLALDLRVALLHLEKLLRIPVAEKCHADNTESVGAHVGNLLGDVNIHAVD